MIQQWLADLGPWSWFIIGLLLMLAELILPGVFLIWFGISALVIVSVIAPFDSKLRSASASCTRIRQNRENTSGRSPLPILTNCRNE